MMYLHYVLLVLCSLVTDLLNFFLAPVAVLFAGSAGWLPKWLSWFQTPDNSLDGDKGWKTKNRPFLVEDSAFKRWWNRTRWLHRNSMYGFAISVLGAVLRDSDLRTTTGNPKVSNRPLVEGLVVRHIYREGIPIYFQWYYVKQWSKTRCIRINMGWKLWGDKPSGQLVFSPNPFMGLSEK